MCAGGPILARRGITRLMVEGGAETAATLVERGLADEVILIEGALEIGEDGLKAFGETGPELVSASPDFVLAEEFALGEDHWRRFGKRG
jgi:diaminohydroxyphosphoribosylaminopyrimidine deaminase/5-amino-6-(5-phosphoribosylamino)uracil reductase